jgi:sporadic carbohydrate cluster protein (TIGR04323 family)
MDKCISYTNTHTQYTEKIPIHLQRLMIKEHCSRFNLLPSFEHNEITTLQHMPMLDYILSTEESILLLMFSIYSLPEDKEQRASFLMNALKQKIEIHFSNEGIILKDSSTVEHIEDLFNFFQIK